MDVIRFLSTLKISIILCNAGNIKTNYHLDVTMTENPPRFISREEWENSFRSIARNFLMVPYYWDQYDSDEFEWRTIKFNDKAAMEEIPEETGIYVFSVIMDHKSKLNQKVIFYVGKTGKEEAKTVRDFKVRMKEYLNFVDKKRLRRTVDTALYKWSEVTFVSYTIIHDVNKISEVEEKLIRSIRPFANERFNGVVNAPIPLF